MNIDDVARAIRYVKEADYLIISAGAGLSASAGLDYTSEELFAQLYPTMHRLGFRCMYEFIGHLPISEELKWGYLFTHTHKARFAWGPTELYRQLLRLAESKGPDRYFVKTSNVDGFFEQAGFDRARVFTPQGDYANMQCLRHHAHNGAQPTVFPSRPFIEAALPHIDTETTMEITEPSKMPKCPSCGGPVFFNVRGGDWFVETPYREKGKAYRSFVQEAIEDALNIKAGTANDDDTKPSKTVVILEIGAGFNTPGVLRWPNEYLLEEYECVRLVRLNRDYPQVPKSVRAVGVPLDASLVMPLFLSDGVSEQSGHS